MERERLLASTFAHKQSAMEAALASRSHELEACQARVKSLEDSLAHREATVAEQKLLLERTKEESLCAKREFEVMYDDIVAVNMQLETKLQDLLNKSALLQVRRKAFFSGG